MMKYYIRSSTWIKVSFWFLNNLQHVTLSINNTVHLQKVHVVQSPQEKHVGLVVFLSTLLYVVCSSEFVTLRKPSFLGGFLRFSQGFGGFAHIKHH